MCRKEHIVSYFLCAIFPALSDGCYMRPAENVRNATHTAYTTHFILVYISAIFNDYSFTVLLTRKHNIAAISYTNFTRNYFEMIEISCNFIIITCITFKILLLITIVISNKIFVAYY
jgi:hypothetical protein